MAAVQAWQPDSTRFQLNFKCQLIVLNQIQAKMCEFSSHCILTIYRTLAVCCAACSYHKVVSEQSW